MLIYSAGTWPHWGIAWSNWSTSSQGTLTSRLPKREPGGSAFPGVTAFDESAAAGHSRGRGFRAGIAGTLGPAFSFEPLKPKFETYQSGGGAQADFLGPQCRRVHQE